MRHGNYDAVEFAQIGLLQQIDVVVSLSVGGARPRIIDAYFAAEIFKLVYHIHDARIAGIGAVFFKRQSQDQDLRAFYLFVVFYHHLNDLRSDVASHIIVNAAA